MPKCTVACDYCAIETSPKPFKVSIKLKGTDSPTATEYFSDLDSVLDRLSFLGFRDIALMYAHGRLSMGLGHVVNDLEVSDTKLLLVSPALLRGK